MKRGLNHKNSLPDPEFGRESSESARAIHYVVQKDTLMTYVSALIAQAEPGIVSGSTIERKKMSTKTIYKRIALVAVATLGAGVLSVAPASAANNPAITVGSINLTTVTTAPTVGSAVAINVGAAVPTQTIVATDSFDLTAAVTSYPAAGQVGIVAALTTGAGAAATKFAAPLASTYVASGATLLVQATGGTAVTANGVTSSATVGLGSYSFTPTKAGVYVVTVFHDRNQDGIIGASDVSQTVSITVAAASGYSNSLSTAFMFTGTTATAATAVTTAAQAFAPAAASTNNSALIDLVIKDTSNVDYTSGATLSAEISGPGYLSWINEATDASGGCTTTPTYGPALGRSLASIAIDAQSALYVCADGTTGRATITIKITDNLVTQTLATRSLTFFGAVTKITATGVLTIARAGGSTATGVDTAARTAGVTPSVIIKAEDASGNPVSGLTFTAKSGNTAIMSETITQNEDILATANVSSSGGKGFYNIATRGSTGSASGQTTTLTFRVVDPADATKFLESPVTFTIGGSVATETLAFDKTSYAPGEAMVLTRTAKDSAGNPVFDGATSPAITFSKAVGGTAPAAGAYVKGVSASSTSVATSAVFAPVTTGAISALMTTGATGGATITASSAVATPANAEIAALTTLVNSLVAKINALNKLVVKIQKKVRA
jgi:trimeric autotransporter adhesin